MVAIDGEHVAVAAPLDRRAGWDRIRARVAFVAVVDEGDRDARLGARHGDVRNAVRATPAEVGVEVLVRTAGEDRVDVVLRVRVDRKPGDVAIPRVVGREHRTAAERTVLVAGGTRRSVVGGAGSVVGGGGGGGGARARGEAGTERDDQREDPHVSPFHTSLSAVSGRELEAAQPLRCDLVFASIPSPQSSNLGPFHMYGVLLACRGRGRNVDRRNTLAAARVSARAVSPTSRSGSWYGASIGARLYHVVTDYELFEHDVLRVFQIWKGGLWIWGAVIGGAIAVIVITRRRHMPTLVVMDCLGARSPRRAGDRSVGKLVQPGALREAHHAPVGARDLACSTVLWVRAVHNVPTHLPLRVAVLPGARRDPAARRAQAPVEARPDVRALRDLLHVRPILVREPAHRPRAPHRPAARERLGEHRWSSPSVSGGSGGSAVTSPASVAPVREP